LEFNGGAGLQARGAYGAEQRCLSALERCAALPRGALSICFRAGERRVLRADRIKLYRTRLERPRRARELRVEVVRAIEQAHVRAVQRHVVSEYEGRACDDR
jgi:hypothetical protein